MEYEIFYVVYKLSSLMGSNNLLLVEYEFDNWQTNLFSTEEAAIKALIKEDCSFEEFIILKKISF